MVECHRQIVESAKSLVTRLREHRLQDGITYPPNGSLSSAERAALSELSLSDAAASGLTKMLADASATAVFQWLCVVDAVGDPEGHPYECWLGANLAEPDEEIDTPMLHDEFFDSWWDFSDGHDVV